MCECNRLSMEEYNLRALPRLERLDAIAAKCNFGKWEFECTSEELRYRAIYNRLMAEQEADEVAAGL